MFWGVKDHLNAEAVQYWDKTFYIPNLGVICCNVNSTFFPQGQSTYNRCMAIATLKFGTRTCRWTKLHENYGNSMNFIRQREDPMRWHICHLLFGGVTVPFHAGELRQSGSVVHPLWRAASSLPKAERTEVTTGGFSAVGWIMGGWRHLIESPFALQGWKEHNLGRWKNVSPFFLGVKMG